MEILCKSVFSKGKTCYKCLVSLSQRNETHGIFNVKIKTIFKCKKWHTCSDANNFSSTIILLT